MSRHIIYGGSRVRIPRFIIIDGVPHHYRIDPDSRPIDGVIGLNNYGGYFEQNDGNNWTGSLAVIIGNPV